MVESIVFFKNDVKDYYFQNRPRKYTKNKGSLFRLQERAELGKEEVFNKQWGLEKSVYSWVEG